MSLKIDLIVVRAVAKAADTPHFDYVRHLYLLLTPKKAFRSYPRKKLNQ